MADLVKHTPPNAGVTEIRVHGVGGANPSSMLGRFDVYQVTGDATAGLFRATNPEESDRTVEAYSWGGLTARGRARALWVLLLPFALINLAGWMVEPIPPPVTTLRDGEKPSWLIRTIVWIASKLERTQRILIHVTALAMTGAYVMWIALMSMNLLAYQCGAREACAGDRFYAEFLQGSFFVGNPGRRVVVGALVPLALIALIAVVSKVSRARYESFTVATAQKQSEAGGKAPVLTTEMGDKSFWYTNEWHTRLFRVHIGWTMAFLGGITAYAVQEFSNARPGGVAAPAWATALATVTFWASVALAVGILVYIGLSVAWESDLWLDRKEVLTRGSDIAWWLGLLVMGSSLVAMWQMRAPDLALQEAANADLWGFGWTPVLLFALAVSAVLVFSFVEVAKWAVTCEISPGLFFIAIAGVMILAWPFAIGVFVLAALIAALTRYAEKRLCPPEEVTDKRHWQAIAAPTVALLVLQLLGREYWPDSAWGNAWPRLTPVLFSGAILYLLFHGYTSRRVKEEGWPKWTVYFPLAAAALIVGAGVILALAFDRPDPIYLAFYTSWLLISFFWVAIQPHFGFRWNGSGAVALFGVALTAGLFSGGLIRFVSLLSRDGYTLVSVKLYEWLAVGFVGIMAAALVAFVAWLLFTRITRGTKAAEQFAERAREEASIEGVSDAIARKVKNWISIARGIEAVDVFIMHISMAVLLGLGALVFHFVAEGIPLREYLDQGLGGSWEGLVAVSAWVSLMVALGAVLAVRSGLRDAGFRRQIGIIWDVTSFWPRHFHPFAPPSYAVRTVPELQERLTEIQKAGGAAILSGHSQGSVVAFAAAASLRGHVIHETALVTHGSPLRRFYARFFPSYFRNDLIGETAQRLGPTPDPGSGYWLNFHRETDPVALPLFPSEVDIGPRGAPNELVAGVLVNRIDFLPDVPLDDPPDIVWRSYQRPPDVLWHLNYMADITMSNAVSTLAELLQPPPAAPQPTSSTEE